jgi:cyclomaltodextrinase
VNDFHTPDWVKHAVFYQIFPDRFANGDPTNDPANVQPWGTPPTPHNFMGGDLQGILQKLGYLQELGITAIYLNPIFQATSNHRYNTYDYFRIDPKLGTMEDFQSLAQEMHRRGMRLILDGVFNHCGRGFYAFHDVVENGASTRRTSAGFTSRGFPSSLTMGARRRTTKAGGASVRCPSSTPTTRR